MIIVGGSKYYFVPTNVVLNTMCVWFCIFGFVCVIVFAFFSM